MTFSEAMFYENCLTSDFHTNTVISRRVCLLVKMASKTVIRPIAKFTFSRDVFVGVLFLPLFGSLSYQTKLNLSTDWNFSKFCLPIDFRPHFLDFSKKKMVSISSPS